MYAPASDLFNTCKRMFTSRPAERALLTTFWANDYKRGSDYTIDGRTYRITRYVRASDPRFFEVWGYEVAPSRMTAGHSIA